MSELKAHGVSVLIVYTIHGNHQVMQRVVSPPAESHLYAVDLNSIDIITEDLREAIIRISVGKPEIRDVLPGDSSKAKLTNLLPETTYTAFLRPESNHSPLSTLSVTFTTLPDVLGPAEISLSDSGPHQIRVSWGPLQPKWVQRYTVEFGAIPSGEVRTVSLDSQRSSTLLTGLQPGTQYLVTVNSIHVDGTERAMSVRACTQEALPALTDLQLFTMEQWDMEGEDVQAVWQAHEEDLKGFWVSWETLNSQNFLSDVSTLTVSLPPTTRATRLTRLASNSRVCVSPVYSSGRGDGICCTVKTQSSWLG
ncbi:von Willebrand factor A domain-containing protein 1 [Oryzias melastigma]|uniref:von Willebrand factor A domain-containing protein 1 n=1 Tax=Oryzias melastigma TaxID=30732 RepID=A0A834FLL2_ORYME|nr:von Willebrand factor A domain-containing protein 1 [Oryzias melastigma]